MRHESTTGKVLVLGGGARSFLSVIRSLGRDKVAAMLGTVSEVPRSTE